MQDFIKTYREKYYNQIEQCQKYLLAKFNDENAKQLLNETQFRLKIVEETQSVIDRMSIEADKNSLKAFDMCVELYRKMNHEISKNNEALTKVQYVAHEVNKSNKKQSVEKINTQIQNVCIAYEKGDTADYKDKLEKLCCAFLYNFLVIRESYFSQNNKQKK